MAFTVLTYPAPFWLNALLLVLLVGQAAVGGALYVMRRNLFPLTGRSAPLVVSIAIATLLSQLPSFGELIVGIENVPCTVFYFSNQWVVFYIASAYFSRAGRVWFQYSAACAKYENNKYNDWFVKRRHWVGGPVLLGVTLACTSVMGVCSAIWFSVLQPSEKQPPSCTGVDTVGPVLFAFGSVFMLFGIWVVYKLRAIDDGFRIKSELKYVSILGLVVTVFAASLRATHVTLFFKIAWFIIMSTFLSLSIHFPLYLSFKYRRWSKALHAASSINRNYAEFTDVLADEDQRELFVEHLKREFSVENILFFNAVKEFEEGCRNAVFVSAEAKNFAAVSIYAEYVASNAPSQVNLSHTTLMEITNELGECFKSVSEADLLSPEPREEASRACCDDIFTEASNCAFNLMKNDSFPRFQAFIRELHSASRNKSHKRGSGHAVADSVTASISPKSGSRLRRGSAQPSQQQDIVLSPRVDTSDRPHPESA